jgi:DNA-binding protein HU-beta
LLIRVEADKTFRDKGGKMAEKKMNKTRLIEELAKKSNVPKSRAEANLNLALEIISNELKKGNSVQLSGFGTFSVRKRAARKGVNPATGQKIIIKAKKVPVFKPGAILSKIVM